MTISYNLLKTRGAALAGVALALTMGVASARAESLVLENVRVRLPGGQVISISDGSGWYRDPRVVQYRQYYYEPARHEYVVYDKAPPRWKQEYRHRERQWCPPGQARKGRC